MNCSFSEILSVLRTHPSFGLGDIHQTDAMLCGWGVASLDETTAWTPEDFSMAFLYDIPPDRNRDIEDFSRVYGIVRKMQHIAFRWQRGEEELFQRVFPFMGEKLASVCEKVTDPLEKSLACARFALTCDAVAQPDDMALIVSQIPIVCAGGLPARYGASFRPVWEKCGSIGEKLDLIAGMSLLAQWDAFDLWNGSGKEYAPKKIHIEMKERVAGLYLKWERESGREGIAKKLGMEFPGGEPRQFETLEI